MTDAMHTFLLCTVGGSPEPIVASLKYWAPRRIVFLPSEQTRGDLAAKVLPLLEREAAPLDPGLYDVVTLPDAQDLSGCVRKLRELTPRVEDWLGRGDEFQVVLDFTGGTKCMSAALALQGRRWRCSFSYVGGTERTKENVGVVVSGKEQIVHAQNPWGALGFQAVEDAMLLFDQGVYDAAAALLQSALRSVGDAAKKREINALQAVAEAYDHWDRFKHKDAMNKLRDAEKGENDFTAMLGGQRAGRLLADVRRHRSLLEIMAEQPPGPTRERVADLIANARRCRRRGRYDDAVARLYRAIEAVAQCRLGGEHQISDTGHVPLDRLPGELRQTWANRLNGGAIFLGLQDDYELLASLGNPLGALFRELDLHDRKKSPLTARNQSILAHGFDAVSPKVFDQLWEAALRLAGLEEGELVQFPTLL